MQRIIAPIHRKELGAAVRNLQDGLLLLLSAASAEPTDREREALIDKLAAEQREGVYSDVTTQAVARFQREQRVAFDLPLDTGEQVDEATAGALNRMLQALGVFERAPSTDFFITGRVEFEDGTPGAGLRVDAFDRDLGRHRVLLGDVGRPVVTGEDGVFPTIRYRAREFAEGEGRAAPNANLVFEITAAEDQSPRPIARLYRRFGSARDANESPEPDLVLGFEAAQLEDLRIVVAGRPGERGLAEYKRLLLALEPMLLDNATPADLDQERSRDIDFVARETNWPAAQIATMTLAWQLARAATREPVLLTETFYGLLRHGAPTEVAALASTLPELLEQDASWESKLEDSLEHRIIDGSLAEHLQRLRELRIDAQTRGGDGRRAGMGDVLAHAGIPEDERRTLLNAYAAHRGKIEVFWRDAVPQRLGWDAEKIQQVQNTLHLADVLAYDLPLMSGLREKGISAARDLVQLERAELVDLVTQLGPAADAPGTTLDERVTCTVNAITAVVDATYPTETMAHLARRSGDAQLTAARDLLARFFEREAAGEPGERFDIRTSPVSAYLETHGRRVFAELGQDDKTLLTAQLQRLQRVFRLGIDRAQSEALLALDLDSAFHITRFSPEHFAAEFGERLGGAERAAQAYGRAEKVVGAVLHLYTDLWQGIHDVKPLAMRLSSSTPEKIAALKELPAYRALFGGLKLCECMHCQSFYSPAAYFVDLLHMLDRPTLGAMNPVDVLFRRRPDLAHIQLTCENTHTLIPYVDLATEVLESLVANRAPKAFNVPPGPPHRLLPSPSAAELRVNPVHLTKDSAAFADQAYEALQEAVFPLTLPLNLPLEETRVYLDHLGTSRAELMPLLDRDAGLEAQMARAAEILLLSPEEFELITGASFGGLASTRVSTEAEHFGLSMGPTPATLFNHAAPEFVLNAGKPDERAASIRSLQNVLSISAPAPIPISGLFDAVTTKAVNDVLAKKGLAQNGRTDDVFWGALEADGMPSLSVLMCPVPMFLERSGLSYIELLALVKTRFVNRTLQGEGDLDYLARLGIPAVDVRVWIQSGLAAVPAPIQTQLAKAAEDPIAFTKWVEERARAVVINTGFESPCDLDRATLMHLDGTLLAPEELVRLQRLIRVWRKLGWSLEDLDQVLEPGALESAAVFETVMLLANTKQLLDELNPPVADLVSIWQPIPTHGEQCLFDRLFRNRAALLIDPILELDRERTELKAAAGATPPALSNHLGPVLAAFRISAVDLQALRQALGLVDGPGLALTPLTLGVLSSIYRKVALARALRVSPRELLALVELSGLAVFERPDRAPRGHALAFVALVQKVRAAGVKVGELEYLCGVAAQPPGPAGAQREASRRVLSSILDGLRAIAAEEPIEHDPAGEALTTRMTELLGADDARATTALIFGRDTYSAPLAGLPAAFVFPSTLGDKITYDAARKQLRCRGAMTAPQRAVLLAAAAVPAAVQVAFSKAVKALDAQPRAFVMRALAQIYSPAEAQAALIDVSSLDGKGAPVAAVIDAKIDDLLARRRAALSLSLIKQTLTGATGLPADIVEALLETESVLKSMSGTGPAIDDLQALDGDGLDAEYFANPDLLGASSLQRVDATVGFDLQGALPGPGVPAVGFSVRWSGHLYVPATGEVTFHVRCTDGVRVWVNDAQVIDEWQDQPETEFDATLRLDGGQFYAVTVEYYNKTGAVLLELGWSSPAVAAGAALQASLYTAARLEVLLRGAQRIYKIALLFTPFKLTARELVWLAEHSGLALDQMPLIATATPLAAQAMFVQWLALFDFVVLRDRYSSSDVSLIDVPAAASPEEAYQRFSTLSGAAEDTIQAIVDTFTVPVFDGVTATWVIEAPDLTTLSWWGRIAEVLALVQRTGATPQQLLAWAQAREIRQLATGPDTLWRTWAALDADGNNRSPDNTHRAQEAKNLVRARYDEERWRAEARALNDLIRIRRRSALTAFVLALPDMMRAHVSDSGRLFEFLLIDVEMEPCMETSRIKQGISSVQHFVQRVLLDLESPQVPPARVDHAQWEWKKNYRVWEANRKVFLYPESYIVAELRDDKTPIFKELESELLQDELTEPNAERTFRHYLEKLDGVAKLIVCGTCIDSDAGTLHVFGRTSTTPFVFYHRWLDKKRGFSWTEGVWSPWQKLPVDVATIDDGDNSGAHLLPIMWNRRLYLFWPLFEQKPDDALNATLPEGFDQINCWHIKLAWSEYKDGRWSPKQTGVPFVVSDAAIENRTIDTEREKRYSVGVIHHAPETVKEYSPPLGAREPPPGDLNYEKFKADNTKTRVVQRPDEIASVEIGDDALLNGTKLKAAGDWALHVHREHTLTIASLLAKPSEHYLDAQIGGSGLTIRVLCRFTGLPTGQTRYVTEDEIAVVRDGQRTDRNQRSQDDCLATGTGMWAFELIGTFQFPGCNTELSAVQSTETFDYNSLQRPESTVNSFMGLRRASIGIGKVKTGLRLTQNAPPILEFGSTKFNVIDSDNNSGFDRSAPFFYQDPQRCYLVTHETYARLFATPEKFQLGPDARVGFAERAVSHAAVFDHYTGLAPEASARTNPWAQSALVDWSAGPAVPTAMRLAVRIDPLQPNSLVTKSVFASEAIKAVIDLIAEGARPEYTFTPHWHAYTCPFIGVLNGGGLPELFTLANQSRSDEPAQLLAGGMTRSHFESIYKPDNSQVADPWPLESVDFSPNGAYSLYNWEIFFHAPMTVAAAYSRAGRHEDALRWIRFVFDPMTGDATTGSERFWRFVPFREADTKPIDETLDLLIYAGSDSAKLKQRANIEASIQEWTDNPFNPHLIARRRHVAYMKYVFMACADNLIAWADKLFQRDTIESINEALQLYVLVANLLGPRPQRTPAPGAVAPESYESLRKRLNALSNAQVDLETRLPFTQIFGPGSGMIGQLSKLPQTLYFCLPQNDQMLAYWDTIADRLFKIRHCMSLDGTVRQLPLFEPPIDPMLLVEAVAHGLDIGSVLDDLYAPLPRYRCSFMIAQSLAMCSEVRSLGSTLLSIFEKRDSERLSALRAGQEIQLLEQVRANRKLQIDEAEQARQALEETARITSARIDYYENLLAQGLIAEETDQLGSLDLSNQQQEMASWIDASAQLLNLIPNVSTEPSTSFGGSNLGAAASAVGRSFSGRAAAYSYRANRASITGGHTRRAEDWRFQRDQAKRELRQVERQKAAARIRKEVTQADLRNHETSIEHARGVEELLRTKFTNTELYGVLADRASAVYFQAYQLAYKLAKRAERCWQYQSGTTATFIKFGAWDSSVRGLLAGEQLYLQIKQLEQASLEQKVDELEITRNVSVSQLDPLALIDLKETGVCEVDLPEWLFDLDYPGHYFRRIKTVSVTIPAVVGPYTSISATLTLLSSKVRESGRVKGAYGDDENYRSDHLAVQAIAVSTGQNDSGRFSLELRDEKYLPFEGVGLISRWRIEVPRKKFRSFDYDTLWDVVLQYKYTARRDDMLAGPALKALEDELAAAGKGTLFRLFSLRHEFPGEWQQLKEKGARAATITIAKDRFPMLVQSGVITVTELQTLLILKEPRPAAIYKATLTPGAGASINLEWPGTAERYRRGAKPSDVAIPILAQPEQSRWQIQIAAPVGAADLEQIQDFLIVARYSVAPYRRGTSLPDAS